MEFYEEIYGDTIVYNGYYYLYGIKKYSQFTQVNKNWTVTKYRENYPGIRIFIKHEKPRFDNKQPFPHGY